MQGRYNIIIVFILLFGGGILLFASSFFSSFKPSVSLRETTKETVSFVDPSQTLSHARSSNPYSDLSPDELIAKASGIIQDAERMISGKKIPVDPLSSSEKEKIEDSANEITRKIDILSSKLKQ